MCSRPPRRHRQPGSRHRTRACRRASSSWHGSGRRRCRLRPQPPATASRCTRRCHGRAVPTPWRNRPPAVVPPMQQMMLRQSCRPLPASPLPCHSYARQQCIGSPHSMAPAGRSSRRGIRHRRHRQLQWLPRCCSHARLQPRQHQQGQCLRSRLPWPRLPTRAGASTPPAAPSRRLPQQACLPRQPCPPPRPLLPPPATSGLALPASTAPQRACRCAAAGGAPAAVERARPPRCCPPPARCAWATAPAWRAAPSCRRAWRSGASWAGPRASCARWPLSTPPSPPPLPPWR